MKLKTNYYIFLSSLAIFFYVLFSASCQNEIPIVNTQDSLEALPVESGKDVEITYSDSAQIKMKIFANKMDRFSGAKEYTEMPKGVKVSFFNTEMKEISRLTAKYAIRSKAEGQAKLRAGKMEARNDVVVTNDKGETLNTEQLNWDEEKKIIYTEKEVKVSTPKEVIFGMGLEATEDFSKWVIKNPTGIINITSDNE